MQVEWWVIFSVVSALVFGCLIGIAIGALCSKAKQADEQSERIAQMQRYGKVIE